MQFCNLSPLPSSSISPSSSLSFFALPLSSSSDGLVIPEGFYNLPAFLLPHSLLAFCPSPLLSPQGLLTSFHPFSYAKHFWIRAICEYKAVKNIEVTSNSTCSASEKYRCFLFYAFLSLSLEFKHENMFNDKNQHIFPFTRKHIPNNER